MDRDREMSSRKGSEEKSARKDDKKGSEEKSARKDDKKGSAPPANKAPNIPVLPRNKDIYGCGGEREVPVDPGPVKPARPPTLGGDEPGPLQDTASYPAQYPSHLQPEQPRVYNAWFEEGGAANGSPSRLEVGKKYHLDFYIGRQRPDSLIKEAEVSEKLQLLSQTSDKPITLTVMITCSICETVSQAEFLDFSKEGDTKIVKFPIVPLLEADRSTIRIAILYNNFQYDEIPIETQISSKVGDVASLFGSEAEKKGLSQPARMISIETLLKGKSRQISITLTRMQNDAYEMRIMETNARINVAKETQLTKAYLLAQMQKLRGTLYLLAKAESPFVMNKGEVDALVFSKNTRDEILNHLAEIGSSIYKKLFSDTLLQREFKRAIEGSGEVTIFISPADAFVPWNFLYDKPFDSLNPKAEKEKFWGYKYILDVLPGGFHFSSTPGETPPQVPYVIFGSYAQELAKTTPRDSYIQLRKVHRDLFNGLFSTMPGWWTEATSEKDLYGKLAASHRDINMIYFFTHGTGDSVAWDYKDYRGMLRKAFIPDANEAVLLLTPAEIGSGIARLTSTLLNQQENKWSFSRRPLVFINACQSGEYFTFAADNFVTEFLRLGARGIIVTESPVWQTFASKFGQAFLKDYLSSNEPAGNILLRLRKTFLDEDNNPLGFLYTYYGDSNITYELN
jgi:hypothetical protein